MTNDRRIILKQTEIQKLIDEKNAEIRDIEVTERWCIVIAVLLNIAVALFVIAIFGLFL